MSEGLVERTASLWSEQTELVLDSESCRTFRSAASVAPADLPSVQPGELWYVELSSTEPELSPLEYQVLTTANVLIYDRAIAAAVARFLPIGGYAELAIPGDRAWERGLRFARDGWSVARLVEPGWEPRDSLRRLSEQLPRTKASGAALALVFASGGGRYERSEVELEQLGDVADHPGFQRSPALTIVFRAVGAAGVQSVSPASTNGLAG
jgi:hypothetical protein